MDTSNPPIIKFYDVLGEKYDWFSIYEARAKTAAFEWLELLPGKTVLNIGIGSGKDHTRIHEAIQPGGKSFGMDLSCGMLESCRRKEIAELVLANARQLPFTCGYFDRIYCSYMLDILPLEDLPEMLVEFSKRLSPGGRMVLLSLTEGIDLPSRLIVSLWNQVYNMSATACGGCRPLALVEFAEKAGLTIIHQEIIVQLGIPSQLVVIKQ